MRVYLKNRHIRNKIISCSQCERLYDLSKYFSIVYDNTEVFRKLSNYYALHTRVYVSITLSGLWKEMEEGKIRSVNYLPFPSVFLENFNLSKKFAGNIWGRVGCVTV